MFGRTPKDTTQAPGIAPDDIPEGRERAAFAAGRTGHAEAVLVTFDPERVSFEGLLELPSESRVLEAARIKARYPMAFADAYAVATALGHDAVILTGDPEILDAGGPWRSLDLRS